MDSVGLKLAVHKMDAVLITSRKVANIFTFKVGDYEYTSYQGIRSLYNTIST